MNWTVNGRQSWLTRNIPPTNEFFSVSWNRASHTFTAWGSSIGFLGHFQTEASAKAACEAALVMS